MNHKLIFFDIDGTLLSKEGVAPSTVECLQQLQAAGHKTFICTGRSKSMVPRELSEGLGFDGMVAGCGMYGEYQGIQQFNIELSQEEVKSALKRLEEHEVLYIFEGTQYLYYNDVMTGDQEKPFIIQMVEQQMKDRLIKLEDYTQPIIANKFSAIVLEEDEQKFYDEFKEDYEVQLHTSKMAEFVPKGHSKATGIQRICELLGATVADTVCFGDSINDIEMLSYCALGICMGNGSAIAKENSDYITDAITEDGIYNACKHFALI